MSWSFTTPSFVFHGTSSGTMIPRLAVFFVCCVTAGVLAVPIPDLSSSSSSCSTECHNTRTTTTKKFNYEAGQKYTYTFAAKTRISTDGSSEESTVTIKALVDLMVVEGCQYAIQFRTSKLVGLEGPAAVEFSRELEFEPLYFTFEDGHIEDLCPGDHETTFSLNIKRAFLSAIQNTMLGFNGFSTHDEVDILGKCETLYDVKLRSYRGITVRKTKDVRTCRDHQVGSSSFFPDYIYTAESGIHNMPLFTTNYTCVQTIHQEIMTQVTCTETKAMSPLVASKGNAEIVSTINIDLEGKSPAPPLGRTINAHMKSLEFTKPETSPKDALLDVENILKNLCRDVEVLVNMDAPMLYSHLVHALKHLTKVEFDSLYSRLKGSAYCQSQKLTDLFVDAAVRAQTGPAHEFVAHVIRNGEISALRADFFYLLLSMAPRSSQEAIEAFLPILKSSPSRMAILGISSLVGRACESAMATLCENNPAFQEVVATLANQIPDDCQTSGRDEELKTLLLLKALGNTHITRKYVDTVFKCAAKKVHTPIRIAAIEALRDSTPLANVTERMFEILKDDTDNCVPTKAAIVRVLLRLPSHREIDRLIDFYRESKSYQLTSYMFSIFKNILNSDDPQTENLRNLLSYYNLERLEKYEAYLLQASQQYDFSQHSDSLNLGYSDTLDVIFPEDTYLPRYFRDQFNTRTFGSYNDLFEVSSYAGGFEEILETLVGPDGFLTNLSEYFEDKFGGYPQHHHQRGKRSTDLNNAKLNGMLEKVRSRLEPSRRFELLAGLRVFGKDILQLSYDDVVTFFNEGEKGLDNLFKKLSENKKYEISRGLSLLDMHLTTPTITGLPLNLDLNSSAVIGLSVDGAINLNNLKTDLSANVDATIAPSFAVDISAQLTVDAKYKRHGMSLHGAVNAGTKFGLEVVIQRGHVLDLNIRLPEGASGAEAEIIVSAYRVGGNEHHLMISDTKSTPNFCLETVGKLLGIRPCFAALIPRPVYSEKIPFLPLNSELRMKVALQKSEPSMTGYRLHLEIPDLDEYYKKGDFIFEFDTPGSTVDRHTRLHLGYIDEPGAESLKLDIKTPFNLDIFSDRPHSGENRIVLTVTSEETEDHVKLNGDLTINQVDRYSMLAVANVKNDEPTSQLTLDFEFQCPHDKPFTANALVEITTLPKKRNFLFELRSSLTGNNEPLARGTLSFEDYDDSNSRGAGAFLVALNGYQFGLEYQADNKGDEIIGERRITYQFPGKSVHFIRSAAKFKNRSVPNSVNVEYELTAEYSEFPEYNLHFSTSLLTSDNEAGKQFTFDATGCRNVQCDPDSSRLLLSGKIKERSLTFENIIRIPVFSVDIDNLVQAGYNPDTPSFDFEARTRSKGENILDIQAYYKRISDEPLKGEGKLTVLIPKDHLTLLVRLEKVSDNEFRGTGHIQAGLPEDAKLDFIYRVSGDPQHSRAHTLEGTVTPGSGTPVSHKTVVHISPTAVLITSGTGAGDVSYLYVDGAFSTTQPSKLVIKVKDDVTKIHVDPFGVKKEVSFVTSIDKFPSKNFLVSASLEATEHDLVQFLFKIGDEQEPSYLDAKLNENILGGMHTVTIYESGIVCVEPTTFRLHYTARDGVLSVGIEGSEKSRGRVFLIDLSGKYIETDDRTEVALRYTRDTEKIGLLSAAYSFDFVRDLSMGVNHLIRLHRQEGDLHYRLNIDTARPREYGDFTYTLLVETPEPDFQSQGVSLTGTCTATQFAAKLEATRNSKSLGAASFNIESTGTREALEFNVKTTSASLRNFHAHVEYTQQSTDNLDALVKLNDKDLLVAKASVDRSRRRSNFKLNTYKTPRVTGEIVYADGGYKYNIAVAGKPTQLFTASGHVAYLPNVKGDVLFTLRGEKVLSLSFNSNVNGEEHYYELAVQEIESPFVLKLKTSPIENKRFVSLTVCQLHNDRKCFGVDLLGTYVNNEYEDRIYIDFKYKINDQPYLSILYDYLYDYNTLRENITYVRDNLRYSIAYDLTKDDTKSFTTAELGLPNRLLRYHREGEETAKLERHEIEFLPNAEGEPDKKMILILDYKETGACEDSKEDCGVEGSAEFSIPEFNQPKRLEFYARRNKDSDRPLEAKLELQLAPQKRNHFILEFYAQRYPGEDRKAVILEFRDGERKRIDNGLEFHFISPNPDHNTFKMVVRYLDDEEQRQEGHAVVEIYPKERQFVGTVDLFNTQGTFKVDTKAIEGDPYAVRTEYEFGETKGGMNVRSHGDSPCIDFVYLEAGELTSTETVCYYSGLRRLFQSVEKDAEGNERLSFTIREVGSTVVDIHLVIDALRLGEITLYAAEMDEKLEYFDSSNPVISQLSKDISHVYKVARFQVGMPVRKFLFSDLEVLAKDIGEALQRVHKALLYIANNLDKVEACIENIIEKLDKILDLVLNEIESHLPEKLVKKLHELAERIDRNLDTLCDDGTTCDAIFEEYEKNGFIPGTMLLIEKAKDYPLEDTLNEVMEIIKELALTVPGVEESVQAAEKYMYDVSSYVQESRVVKLLQDRVDVDEVRRILDEYTKLVLHAVETAYKQALESKIYQKTLELLEEIVKEVNHVVGHYDEDRLERLLEDIMLRVYKADTSPYGLEILTVAPETVEYKIRLRLPFDVYTLRQALIEFTDDLYYDEDDEDSYYPYIPEEDLRDNLIELLATLLDEYLPPYEAQAHILGGTHFVTFDEHEYQFASDHCSYVLARDFLHDKFMFLIKYHGVNANGLPRTSIIVRIARPRFSTFRLPSITLEIDMETGKILQDGSPAEYPILYDRLSVFREGQRIFLKAKDGVYLDCDIGLNLCTIRLSGFHYGKTAGLLGTYDFDHENDMQRPRGGIAKSIDIFAKSYEAEPGCKTKNLIKEEIALPEKDSEVYEICKKFLSDEDSNLRNCFHMNDIETYFDICARYALLTKSYQTPKESACKAVAIYARDCDFLYAPVVLPDECSVCHVNDKVVKVDDSTELTSSAIPRSADVVFLVEEVPCNERFMSDFESIARLIDRELVDSGLSDNRYAVVGFHGRRGFERHVHTVHSQPFFSIEDIALGLKKLGYTRFIIREPDIYDALHYVLDLNFRPGVSKNVVLIKCTPCHEEVSHQLLYFLEKLFDVDLQTEYLSQGVKLHVIDDGPIEVVQSPQKTKGIYGLDADTVYRGKDVSQKDLTGTPDLINRVAVPKDGCVALAQEVGGSYFIRKDDRSSTEQKNFKTLLARRIAKTAEPSQCEKCVCTSDYGTLQARTECTRCEVPKPKQPVRVYTSDDGYFV